MKITTLDTRTAMGAAIQQVRRLILPVQKLVVWCGLEVAGAMARAVELLMGGVPGKNDFRSELLNAST
jgi:hypothetical protein